MNKDKIIKDLKKRNDSLKMQYEYRNIRCIHLENENNKLQQENQQLKENYDRIYNENCKLREEHNITDISLLDENQQLKKQKDDVVEYIKKHTKVKVMFEDEIDEILRMLGEIDDK